jgi:hypothetical protein
MGDMSAPSEGNVTITKEEYLHLRMSTERFERLERAGIRRWYKFGEALNSTQIIDEWDKLENERINNL